jgi:hypothetical protein
VSQCQALDAAVPDSGSASKPFRCSGLGPRRAVRRDMSRAWHWTGPFRTRPGGLGCGSPPIESVALGSVIASLAIVLRIARGARDTRGRPAGRSGYAGRNGAGVASNAGMVNRAIVPNPGAGLHA